MQANERDSTVVSEAPSSDDSEDDDKSDFPVTEEWARDLIISTGVLSPHEVQVLSRAAVTGPLSRVIAVTICFESNGEHKTLPVVVKLPPKELFGRLFVAEAQFDSREILFYTELAPTLNQMAESAFGAGASLPIPKCLKFQLPDEIGGESELVLEDVSITGFKAADFSEGLNLQQAKSALHAAARLHALSLALREREGQLDERFDFLFPYDRATAGYLRLVKRGLPQLIQYLQSQPDCSKEADAVKALADRAPEILSSLIKPTEPALLVHADFWSGNLLFKENGDNWECMVLDWQMVSLGRPMDDVALLLLSSLPPELRRSSGNILIEEYGHTLQEECCKLGVISIGIETSRKLKSDWKRAALRALLLCAGSVDVALGDPRAEERLLEAVRDLYNQGVLITT